MSYTKDSINAGREQKMIEQRVTCTLAIPDKFYIVEHMPARVDEETGEQFFAPPTVEHLRETILGQTKPSKVIETPVYEYSE